MKHLYNLTLGLAAAAAMSLASCADDAAAPDAPAEGRTVWMSIDVSRGTDPDSRLTHTEDANGLKALWEKGDILHVVDGNSQVVGVLTLDEEDDGEQTGTFTGTLRDLTDGNTSLTLVYAGRTDVETPRHITANRTEIDLSTQSGAFADMALNDIMSKTVEVVVANRQATAKSGNTVVMDHECNFALFDTDLEAGVKVTISATTYQPNKITIKTGDSYGFQKGTGTMTVTTQENGLIYVNLAGISGNPAFSFTANGKTVTLPQPTREWLAEGNYYRAGWNTTSATPEGIPVNFNADPAPAVDHSKNPLLKWAEGDLVYDKSTHTSSVASSHLTRGSFYQWGLNTGYENYVDARGNLNSYLYNYVTYGQQYWTGTGVTYGYIHRSRYSYSSKTDIKTANDNGRFIMNPPTSPDANNPLKYDYWLSSFGDGGSTWQERADAVGINMTLIPTGYRLPTQADFQEIMPSERILSSSTLTSTLNSNSEIRTNNNCSYAIKWTAERINSRIYLRIDALVVPSTTMNVNNVNWNDSNVKTRYFGGNGGIHAFYHLNYGTYGNKYFQFPVARPMPAIETHNDIANVLNSGDIYVLWDNVIDHSVNNEGYYWMSDKKGAFYFSDNSNWSGSFSNRQSVVGYQNVSPQDCCTIRCIDTSKE